MNVFIFNLAGQQIIWREVFPWLEEVEQSGTDDFAAIRGRCFILVVKLVSSLIPI